MLDKLFTDLASLHPLIVGRTIYIPAWSTNEDEIYELSGIDDGLVEHVGEYFQIDVPEELEDLADTTAFRIARERFGIKTLREQKSDRLDFHSLAVWSIRDALVDAFEAGAKSVLDNQ